MKLIPITTEVIRPGDDLEKALTEAVERYQVSGIRYQVSDIVIASSKAVATSEGRVIDLSKLAVSDEAKTYAKQCGRSEEFCQAVLDEVTFRNGTIHGTCSGAMLTELKPEGLNEGTIFSANAGLDESNAPENHAVGWPEDPIASASKLKQELNVGAVIISDSCCRPRRWGVTAFALACAGIDPLLDQAGSQDLFGRNLRITKEATADQLATAANVLMGNANQSVPAVIIRDHGLPLSNFEGWIPGINPEEDLFRGII